LAIYIIFFCGAAAKRGPWLSSFMRFLDHTQRRITVGRLLWTSDQLVAETSTWQHTTDKHPCHRWDSKPQS